MTSSIISDPQVLNVAYLIAVAMLLAAIPVFAACITHLIQLYAFPETHRSVCDRHANHQN